MLFPRRAASFAACRLRKCQKCQQLAPSACQARSQRFHKKCWRCWGCWNSCGVWTFQACAKNSTHLSWHYQNLLVMFVYVFFFPSGRDHVLFFWTISQQVHPCAQRWNRGTNAFLRDPGGKSTKKLQLQRVSSQSPILEMRHASFFSHGNFEPVPWFFGETSLPIWSHLELWTFRSVFDLIQTQDCKPFKKKQRCFLLA